MLRTFKDTSPARQSVCMNGICCYATSSRKRFRISEQHGSFASSVWRVSQGQKEATSKSLSASLDNCMYYSAETSEADGDDLRALPAPPLRTDLFNVRNCSDRLTSSSYSLFLSLALSFCSTIPNSYFLITADGLAWLTHNIAVFLRFLKSCSSRSDPICTISLTTYTSVLCAEQPIDSTTRNFGSMRSEYRAGEWSIPLQNRRNLSELNLSA